MLLDAVDLSDNRMMEKIKQNNSDICNLYAYLAKIDCVTKANLTNIHFWLLPWYRFACDFINISGIYMTWGF